VPVLAGRAEGTDDLARRRRTRNLVEVTPQNPCDPGDPVVDAGRIFSSPAVPVGRSHPLQRRRRRTERAPRLHVGQISRTAAPQWIRELNVDAQGVDRAERCGNVWSSPTIVGKHRGRHRLDCEFKNVEPLRRRLDRRGRRDRAVQWIFDPRRNDPDCDWWTSARRELLAPTRKVIRSSARPARTARTIASTPSTGRFVWRGISCSGGFSGGFIGSTAFDGERAYGASALGDFGRFEGFGSLGCMPIATNSDGHPDLVIQEPSLHALDAANGNVVWQGLLSQSFGPTVVGGGLVFVGTGVTAQIHIHDASTGLPLKVIQLPASSASGIIPAGDTIYFGFGTGEEPIPARRDGVASARRETAQQAFRRCR